MSTAHLPLKELSSQLQRLTQYAAAGAALQRSLADYIGRSFGQHIQVTRISESQLRLVVYGVQILTRIELTPQLPNIDARLAAYILAKDTEAEPNPIGIQIEFRTDGSLLGGRVEQFPERFVEALLNDLVLRHKPTFVP
jgi:hypothetical protein